MLKSDGTPERILAIGPFGSGKTYSWLKIADWSQQTESGAHFYVIDTDAAVRRMVNPAGSFGHLKNITVEPAWGWPQYEKALDTFLTVAKQGDWVIVDFVGSAWDAVQEWYVDQIYDTDIAEFFMEARKSMRSGSPLDGWKDWSVINRIYNRWAKKMVKDGDDRPNIFWTANAEALRDTDDSGLRAMFGAHGVKPRGQKHLGNQVHTVLLLQPFSGGKYFLNTIKDRERTPVTGMELDDFVLQYLVGVAGWDI